MSLNVIMPGGFHPFHAGHRALYDAAKKAFPNANIYVAATNDTKERPFPFVLKQKLAKLSGVQPSEFVQVKSPFQPREITSKLDPNSDVVVFVRSEKDRNESPRAGGKKQDGTPSYFQPWTGKNMQPFGKQAYMAYLPTVEFGPGITSASEIRNAWPKLNDKRKMTLVMSLYPIVQKNPKLAQNVVQMFDQVMSGSSLTESTDSEFILYINDKPAAKYNELYQAEQDIKLIKRKNPNAKFEVKKEVCNLVPVPMGLKEALLREFAVKHKKDDENMFIQSDPESDKLLRFAQQHYPEARSKQQAFIKFVQRALKHSEEEDTMQDKEISQLQKDVSQVKDVVNKIQVSESADYLEEK